MYTVFLLEIQEWIKYSSIAFVVTKEILAQKPTSFPSPFTRNNHPTALMDRWMPGNYLIRMYNPQTSKIYIIPTSKIKVIIKKQVSNAIYNIRQILYIGLTSATASFSLVSQIFKAIVLMICSCFWVVAVSFWFLSCRDVISRRYPSTLSCSIS